METTSDPFDGCEVEDPQGLLERIAKETPPPKRKYTRAPPKPRGRFGRQTDVPLAERLFINGVLRGIGSDGKPVIAYLSATQIASATGISNKSVEQYARRKGWQAKRKELLDKDERNPVPLENLPPDIVPGWRVKDVENGVLQGLPLPANPRARSISDALSILEAYILYFGEKVAAHEVKAESIKDLDIAIRLRAFLMGDAERRSEVKHVITLDEMQSKHRQAREAAIQIEDSGVAGVLAQGDGSADVDATGAPIVDAEFEDQAEAGDAA
jgi:hypothetical protein